MDEKKDASVVPGQSASSGVASVVVDSISQEHKDSQGEVAKTVQKCIDKPGKKQKRHVLLANSKPYAVAIKCYEEQLPYGLDYTISQLQKLDKKQYHALGIKHDRDLAYDDDGIWAASYVKWHLHIIVRAANRNTRFHLLAMMQYLGIVFRPGTDDSLWANGGVESVGNFAAYAVYLTHETEAAITMGKELYGLHEVFSNLTPDEVLQVRDGYSRMVVNSTKVSVDDLVALDKSAYELGLELKDFDAWYDSQPFIVRSNAKMRVIRESYNRGVEQRVRDHKEIQRVCIYIQGEPNTGKTYAARMALAGKRILTVGGGGSGKFDNLRPDHEAILIDDDVAPNLLNMTDNYVCRAYKRNRDNPVWAGRYFVVTSNLPFDEWLKACGIKATDAFGQPTKHFYAMESRFFVCGLQENDYGVNHLACRSVSTRGTADEQRARADEFMQFKYRFDSTIAGYVPGSNVVDFSAIIEPEEYKI